MEYNTIEFQILQNLIYNQPYMRKVLPFLKKEYFGDRVDGIVFELIYKYITQYNAQPTVTALGIDASNLTFISDKELEELESYLNRFVKEDFPDLSWLVDQTESWCKERAVHNALMSAVGIANGTDKNVDKGVIPQILSDALGVSFDNDIGHDFFENGSERFDSYNKVEKKVPFDLSYFNSITSGGLPPKTLNVILAGCVHPDTLVKCRRYLGTKLMGENTCKIKKIDDYLNKDYQVEVYSPDGWVEVNYFVDKGNWTEYVLTLHDGTLVSCNENHLFETTTGWKYAKDLNMVEDEFVTERGIIGGIVYCSGIKIPIVDLNINHPNHRYYTNGVSSHNTGVGKSLMMCHMAAANLTKGLNVLYITLELAEEKIAERIDANMLDIDIGLLSSMDKSVYLSKLKGLKNKTTGKLIIKEFPTASSSVIHFKHLLDELKLKKNFMPDIIYIDYLNICASSRIKMNASTGSYGFVKAIAEEVRGLAQEHNVPIVTATQTTRTGHGSSDISLEDTSESFGVPQTADFMIAISATSELASVNQMMVKQLKSRYGDINKCGRFIIGVDKARMKLYDIEMGTQGITPDAVVTPSVSNGIDSPSDFNSVYNSSLGSGAKSRFGGFS